MHALTTIVGWLAGALTLGASAPQVIKLVRTRDIEGVNEWTYVAWTTTAIWWCAWGIGVGAVTAVIVNALCVPLLLTAVALLRPARRQVALLLASPLLATIMLLTYVPVLAVIASIFQVFIGLPSARLALRPGTDLSGVAVSTWVLLAVNNVLWVIYDVGIGYPLAGAVSLFLALAALVVIVRVHQFNRERAPMLRPS